jgi:hypothetical protein
VGQVVARLSAIAVCILACSAREVRDDARLQPLRLEREAVFGADTGGAQLESPSFGLVAHDGTLIVGNGTRILFFDPEGALIRTLGREGKGPGEFLSTAQAGWAGDTLWVNDYKFGRITYYPSVGLPKIQILPQELAHMAGKTLMRMSDGALLVETGAGLPPRLDQMQGSVPLLMAEMRSDGSPRDTIATYTCHRHVTYMEGEMLINRGSSPISDCPLTAATPDGKILYHISEVEAKSSAKTRFTVTRINPGGSVEWKKEVAFVPQPLSDGILDSIGASFAETGPNPTHEPANQRRARFAGLFEGHKFIPTVSEAVAGTNGTLFLGREKFGSTRTWDVWDATGRQTGTFSLPATAIVLTGASNRIWVVEVNDKQETHIVRYHLK